MVARIKEVIRDNMAKGDGIKQADIEGAEAIEWQDLYYLKKVASS